MLEDTGLYSCPTVQKKISSFSASCTSANPHLWRHLTKEKLGREIAYFWKNAERKREPRKDGDGWRCSEQEEKAALSWKRGNLALTPHLKIAKLLVITQHKDQGNPRLQSPDRQESVHCPVFKARGKRDLGHSFVSSVFLRDNLPGFLVVMLWIHFSSTPSLHIAPLL